MAFSTTPIKARDSHHLKQLVGHAIGLHGPTVDLNFIDVSLVQDFGRLFEYTQFQGRVDAWDTSRATNMDHMFAHCRFNGDISKWCTQNVQSMRAMFMACPFNGDVSAWNTSQVHDMGWMFAFSEKEDGLDTWDVGRVTNMNGMFEHSRFKGKLDGWNVARVENMRGMFERSHFDGDISAWDVRKVRTMSNMFKGCPFHGDLSAWNVQLPVLKQHVVDGNRLVQMKQPCAFHWAYMLGKPPARFLQRRPEWKQHRDGLLHIAQGLGLDRPATAQYMHEQWRCRDMPPTREMFALPNMHEEATP